MTSRPHAWAASRAATALLAAVAFAPRFAWGVAVRVPPSWDGELYERAARGIAQGLGYSCFMFGGAADPRVPTAYYPVGYPALLGAFYAALGVAPWVVALVGSLAGAATVALVHRLALRVSSPRASFAAALCLALMPGQVLYASTPMTETVWGALLTLAVYLLARGDVPGGARAPSKPELVGAAVALAAAVYVRPQAIALAPLLPLLTAGALRARLARAALVTAVTVALVLPWTARNCRAIDGCALVSTNGGGNLAIGAVPDAIGTFRFLTPADGCRGVVGETARDRCWRDVARGHIRARPYRWLRLAWAKLYHTYDYEAFPAGYLNTARPDLVDPAREQRWRRAMSYPWRAALYLAIAALLPLFARRPLRGVGALSVATIAAVTAAHLVFFGGDRYHLPFAGLVLVLASGAFRGAPRWLRGAFALRAAELRDPGASAPGEPLSTSRQGGEALR